MSDVVVSLAILKVNWDIERADYLENFVPFVVDCLKTAPQPEVSLIEIHESLSQRFGLRVPLGPLKTILRRLARRDLVKQAEGVYHRNAAALPDFDLLERREEALSRKAALLQSFIAFCRDRFGEDIDESVAAERIERLVNQWAMPLIESSFVQSRAETFSDEAEQYPAQAFVRFLQEEDSDEFGFLVDVAKGSALANALFFAEFGPVGKHFDRTKVFLDTRILLRTLGHAGPELQAPYVQLVELLYVTGARVRCFEDTVKEAKGILEANAGALRRGEAVAYGETFAHFLHAGYTSSDVLLNISRMERDLEALRIGVEAMPPHEEATTVDEIRLEEVLQGVIGYHRNEARLHDTDAIAAIHTLRRGGVPARVEDAAAIFVTTNTGLVRATYEFVRDPQAGVLRQAPLCLGDHTISTIAWLKQPMQAPDLPKQLVVADCCSALSPPDELWKAYLREIEKLRRLGDITQSDYEILRYTAEAEEMLLDITMGQPAAFLEGTSRQVLEATKAHIRRQAEAERDAALVKAEEADRKADDFRSERDSILKATSIERTERERAIKSRATKFARRGRIAVQTVAVIALIGGLLLSLPLPISRIGRRLPGFVTFLLLATITVVGFVNLVWGSSLRGWLRSLEFSIQRGVARLLTRWLDPPPDQ